MASYSQDEIAAIVERAITTAHNYDNSGSSETKRKALHAYLGKPMGNEQDGRSQQISMDVADMVNAACAQLTPMLATDSFVQFEPTSMDDEERADAESHALNKVVMEDNQGHIKFMMAIHDALLLRLGVIKVTVEEIESAEPITYDNPSVSELAYIEQEMMESNQRMEYSKPDKDGMLKAKRITTNRTFKIACVNPINFLYDRNHHETDVQNCRFVAERMYITRSDLIEVYGIDKAIVDDLPEGNEYENNLKVYRDQDDDYQAGYKRELERVEVFECYILLCTDDSGIATRHKVLYANRMILDMEEFPWVPFAVGTAMLYPHEMEGESMFDRINPIQEAKSFTMRQWADNMASLNNARMGVVEGQANMDDVLSGIPGGAIRLRNAAAIVPIVTPDLGSSAVQSLEYQDKLRTERGGASLDMQQAEMQIVGDTAHGVERQFSSKELTVQSMGKVLGETLIRQTYLLMHQSLRMFSNKPLMVRHAGNWQEVQPSDWPERTQLNVTVGQTIGQRNSAQSALMTYIQLGTQAMQSGLGGQLVDLGGIYKAMGDWLEMSGIDNADKYLIDPASPQAQQAQAQQAQQQAQMQEMQMQLEQQARDLDKYKHDTEIQYKYFDAVLDAETKEGVQISNVKLEAAKLAAGTLGDERNRQEGAEERAANSSEDNGR